MLLTWPANSLYSIILGAFSGGAPGWLYDDSRMDTLFQDAAGTTPVTALEQPVGKQLDLSGRGNHRTQPTSANRPTWSARYNLLLATASLSTQSVTTVATNYVLYFTGSGTVTLSGTSTGTLSAGSNTITCTAGALTLTVSGSVLTADLRPADQAVGRLPQYQAVVTASNYDSVGFPAGLRWNGSNSWMQNASNAFNSTGQISLFVGVRKVSTAAGMITETSTNGDSTNGTFQLFAASNASNDFTGLVRSTTLAQGYSNTVAPPSTNVVSMDYDITAGTIAGQIVMRINGVAKTLTTVGTATAGTVFSAQPAYFGSRAGVGYFFNGMTYSNIGIGGGLSASQIAAFNAWTNSKARAA